MPKPPAAITWFFAADQFQNLIARVKAAMEVQELRIGVCLDIPRSRGDRTGPRILLRGFPRRQSTTFRLLTCQFASL
jgi:hypothetical protein